MDSIKNKSNSKLILYIVMIVSFFILMFVTKDQYAILEEKKDAKFTLEKKLEEKKQELTDLNSWRAEMKADKTLDDSVNKFLTEIKDHELYKYIYDYVEDSDSGSSKITIKNMSISEGKINEFGLKEGEATITILVSNDRTLTKFLDFLIREDSDYNFYIHSLSYPNDNRPSRFSVTIPLTILYK